MSNNLALNLILKATDGMSDVVKSACKQSDAEFKKLNDTLEATAGKFDRHGKNLAAFGGVLVGASAINVKMAGDFEAGMNNVSTLIDTSNESLAQMSKEVLSIGKNSPKALSDLTDGLYSIRSAGIDASQQFEVLKGSEMLAVAGLATTAQAVDVATSAINAFNLKGKEADKIYDMFFKVVKYGKTDISAFSQGFGSVAGVVAAANIELDEYSAAVAAMTTSGVQASIAHTQIKAAIAGLSRGSKEQIALFKTLGATSFNDLVARSGGMVGAFNKINQAVGGNQSKLIQLLGSVEAYNAVLSLTGANNAVFNQTLNDMRYGADSLSEAYQKQTAGLNQELAIIGNSLQALSIRLGTALIPVIHAAGGAIQRVTGLIDKMPDGVVNFISLATAGVGALSLLGGTSLIAIGGIIKNVIFLRNVLRTASIVKWAYPMLGPIGLVVAGITALGAAGVYCYNKFEGFRNCCQATWAVIKAGGAWISVLFNYFKIGAGIIWNTISPAVKFGVTVLSWVTPIGLAYRAIKGLVDIIGSLIQRAGGLRGIGAKITNWANNSEKKAQEINGNIKNQRRINGEASKKIDGSHANGLDRVPFNGYIAELHQDEAVLTKSQADRWRSNSTVFNNSNSSFSSTPMVSLTYGDIIIQGDATKNTVEDFKNLLRNHKDEVIRIIEEYFRRREVRGF